MATFALGTAAGDLTAATFGLGIGDARVAVVLAGLIVLLVAQRRDATGALGAR